MPRSFGITLAAAALLALAALTPHGALAAAHGGPGGGVHGGPHGPGGGGWGGGHWGRHFYGPGVVGIPVPWFYYGPDYYYYYYGPEYYEPEVIGPACIRVLRHVHTRHGWRWRHVTVCR